MLNNNYFKKSHSTSTETHNLDVYKVLKNPIILVSKTTKTPIAALHFVSSNANTCISKRQNNDAADFQCMIDKDNQAVEFVISNLTDCNINFNILKENGMALNRCNCLRKYESYSVKCDQENDCEMILKTIKDEKGESVKVSQEKTTKNNTSNYYYLSVIPEGKSWLVDAMKETEWTCMDYIVVKTKKEPVHVYRGLSGLAYGDGDYTQNRRFTRGPLDYVENNMNDVTRNRSYQTVNTNLESTYGATGPTGPIGLEGDISELDGIEEEDEIEEQAGEFRLISKSVSLEENTTNEQSRRYDISSVHIPDPTRRNVTDYNESRYTPQYERRNEVPFQQTRVTPGLNLGYNEVGNHSDLNGYRILPLTVDELRERNNTRVPTRNFGVNTVAMTLQNPTYDLRGQNSAPRFVRSPWLSDDNMVESFSSEPFENVQQNRPTNISQELINRSQLGRINQGERIVETVTEANIDFDYEVMSCPCKINLSVAVDLVFCNVSNEDDETDAKDYLNAFLSDDINKNSQTIYTTEQCTICYDEPSNPPNMIFYQCGHKCCHFECGNKLSKCPMCRKAICAYLK